jgi:hypothetical protein
LSVAAFTVMVMDHTGSLDAPDATTAPAAGASVPEDDAVAALQRTRRSVCAAQAAEARYVAQIVRQARAEAHERIADARGGAPSGTSLGAIDLDVEQLAGSLAVDTVSCALGISSSAATRLVALSVRLTDVLPEALDAWSAGVLDDTRVRVLASATEVVDDDTARAVTRQVLPDAATAPWDGPSPRAWRTRVERAVVRADAEAAARRRAAALAARRVRTWPDSDGIAVLQWRADATEIALADQVITDLARALPPTDEHGVPRTMDQRRTDALSALFHAVRDRSLGQHPDDATSRSTPTSPADTALPRIPVQRVHDLGLVLHADTLFGDGSAADDTAQLRVLGPPAVLDPTSARSLARQRLTYGDAVQVLFVDTTGALQHVIRLDHHAARDACRSRDTLRAAVLDALQDAPALETDGYHPTGAIARYVRADAPTCSFYDCPRRARDSDLDHDTPWPRGPTSVTNLDPKCRRHHHAKTAQAVHTTLHAGPGTGPRHITWQLPGGLMVTTRPESLPGCRVPENGPEPDHPARSATPRRTAA